MLKRFVRAYYRVRYFPRLITEMLSGVASTQARFREEATGLLTGLHQQQAERYRRSASSLDNIHAEITSFCDDATRSMMACQAAIKVCNASVTAANIAVADTRSKVEGMQQTLEAVLARMATLQDELRPKQPPAEWGDVAALAEAVQRQSAELARIERITTRQQDA